HGAIGMTYEVAGGGRGGSTIRRPDDTILTLADRVARHYTTAMATLRTASDHSAELLQYTSEAVRAQSTAAQNTFLILPTSPNFYRAAGQLLTDNVKFSVSEDPVNAGDRSFARGTILILKGSNTPDVDATLTRITRDLNISVFPLESGWNGGTSFGSGRIHAI